jgi:hypothetical protein
MDWNPGSREIKYKVYLILTIPIVMDRIFHLEKKFSKRKDLLFYI